MIFFGRPGKVAVAFITNVASGVMLFLSLVHIFFETWEKIGLKFTSLWFIVGMVIMDLIIRCVPEPDPSKLYTQSGTKSNAKLRRAAFVVVTGIFLHNAPEGMAVCISSMGEWGLGIFLALSIAIHNVMEGVTVAVFVYAATGSKWTAFMWTFFSGLAEPLGAIMFLAFFHTILTEFSINCMLAVVAGMMAQICFKELIPAGFADLSTLNVLFSNSIGMLIMFGFTKIAETLEQYNHVMTAAEFEGR